MGASTEAEAMREAVINSLESSPRPCIPTVARMNIMAHPDEKEDGSGSQKLSRDHDRHARCLNWKCVGAKARGTLYRQLASPLLTPHIAEEAVGIGSLFNSRQRILRLAAYEAALAVSRFDQTRDDIRQARKLKWTIWSLPHREVSRLSRGNPRQFPRDVSQEARAALVLKSLLKRYALSLS